MKTEKNVVYKEGSSDPRHTLDIYTPVQSTGCIVWFHGGGLANGEKDNEETVHVCRTLAGSGFTVVSAGYRLYPQVLYPGQVEDAAAAVLYVHEHVYDGSGPFVLAGHSAGAWLACMVVMDPAYLPPGLVDGIIPVSGQMALHTRVAEELGVPPADPDHPAAPTSRVHMGLPAILLLAGDDDNPGRWDQQVVLDRRLTDAGHKNHSAVQVPDRTHGGIIRRMGEPGDPVVEAIEKFMAGLAT